MTLSSVDLVLQRAELRNRNTNPAPLRTAFRAKLSTLKSDLKKATTLAKRFKNYSAESSEKTILAQLDTLNFGMFLSEAAEGVVQSICHGTKMKSTDVQSFALVCSEVHQRYEGFWPLVQKGLKDNAEKIVDVNLLKTAIERISESAELTRPSECGEGNALMATTTTSITLASGTAVTPYTCPTPPTSATATNLNTGSISKFPMEEFNQLRLVARVFSEWWLVGLLEEAKPILKLLKLLQVLLEKHTSSSTSPLVASTIHSVILLVVRKVGIELLGKDNALFLCIFNKESKGEKTTRRLHDLSTYSGEMTSDQSKKTDATVFLLAPAGARLTFNPTTKSVVQIEEASIQQIEELSWARLCETYKLPEDYYCKSEERRQFASILLASAWSSIKFYNDRKSKLETWWHSLSESHGKANRNTPEEIRFRLFQEYVEEFYVSCDNLLGMLGFEAPKPIDLSVIEPKSTGEIKITSVAKVFHTVKNAESYNRFEDDEKRIFYEYLPDLQVILNELKPLCEAEKANWDLLLRRQAISGAVVTQSSTSSSSSLAGRVEEEVGIGIVVENEESEIENTELDASLENSEESKCQSIGEAAAMMKRRRLRMAALAVPASMFDNYSTMLQLLEELMECNTATAIDNWCECFLQEALRPLHSASESAAGALLFFSNCLMLLSLELRDYPRTRHPEMLPYMARCAAILHQYFPQTGEFLGKNLEADWRRVYKRYSASDSGIPLEVMSVLSTQKKSIRSQLLRHIAVTVRYLCELMKFGVIPPSQVINMMGAAVDDLNHPCSAVTLAAAVKHGGLFLFRNHPTHVKADRLFQKLKKALPGSLLDDELKEIVKSAFDALTPPSPQPKPRHGANTTMTSTLEQYARYLLQSVLSPEKYDFVRTQFLRMPWADINARRGLLRALRALQDVRWDALPLVADLIADLSSAGLESIMQCVIDEVVEDLRRDVEVPANLHTRITTTTRIRGEKEGDGDGGSYVSQKDGTRAVYRQPQWRFIDCVFLANLYRVRVVTIRFIGYIVMMLLLYNPFEDSPKDDYSRLRCCVTLLTECATSFPWWLNPREGSWTRMRRRISRLMERLVTLHQVLRKFVVLLFQHRYTLTEPIPLDLRQRLEELISFFDEHMRRDVKELEKMTGLNAKGKPMDLCQERFNDDMVRAQLLQETVSTPGLPSLATAEEVSAFAEVVMKETMHPDNLWYDKMCKAVIASCRDDVPLFRVFPSRSDEGPFGSRIETGENITNTTITTTTITTTTTTVAEAEAEAGITTASWSGRADSDVLQEEGVLFETASIEHSSDVEENSLVSDSDDDSNSSYSSSCDSSVTTCTERESCQNSRSHLDESDEEESDTDIEGSSYTVNDTSSLSSKSETEMTYEEEEEEEEEDDEEEEEEEEEGEEEDDVKGEDEEAEEVGQENEYFTAAEALRMRLEEAELDAELNALMSNKSHETLPHAAHVNSKAGGVDRLDQELAMSIRLYRQQQQQQQRSNATPSEPNEEQEIRFTLLRRPIPGTSTTGKAGSTTSTPSRGTGTKGNNHNNSANDNNVVLRIPCNSDFAKNALSLQEQQRRQQKELRDAILRITLMQEEEGCGSVTKSKGTR